MPIKNEWIEGIWDSHQVQLGLGFLFWLPSFVLLQWLFARFGIGEETVSAFGALMALVAAGIASDFRDGVRRGEAAIASGAARDTLTRLVEFTNSR